MTPTFPTGHKQRALTIVIRQFDVRTMKKKLLSYSNMTLPENPQTTELRIANNPASRNGRSG